MSQIIKAYELAKEKYEEWGVDTEKAMNELLKIPISLHCWQGDDCGGFENPDTSAGGGTLATGNYPGKAMTADQLRQDLEKAYSCLPGKHRLNLHAFYAETGGKKVDRNELTVEYFKNWIDWCKSIDIGMDFNTTFFAHPKADSNFTLSNRDESIRKFWVEHAIACRKIGEQIGQALGKTCVTNHWIPDGFKDIPVDRKTPREILKKSLDEMFKDKIDPKLHLDAIECKLFGIGIESYTVGSSEFYLGYALKNNKLLCLDAGHFHPTEVISDKISSVLTFLDEILLHVSRPVRWDSDHVVILDDELRAIAREIVCNGYIDRVHIGLDFFDASINRVAAWAIGTRNMIKALLIALLEPTAKLQKLEIEGDYTSRLALLEELKSLPFGAVWDYYCEKQGVPVGSAWLDDVKQYEKEVLLKR